MTTFLDKYKKYVISFDMDIEKSCVKVLTHYPKLKKSIRYVVIETPISEVTYLTPTGEHKKIIIGITSDVFNDIPELSEVVDVEYKYSVISERDIHLQLLMFPIIRKCWTS